MGGKGSGGRNAKPTALKKLQGNPGKRRLNEKEPKPSIGAPDLPGFVKNNPVACAEWHRLLPILLAMKVLRVSDGNALAGLCCAHAQFVEAQRDLAERGNLLDVYAVCSVNGVPITDDEGVPTAVLLNVKKNPSVQIASDADRRLRGYYTVFGLDPVSCSKVKIHDNSDHGDPFEDFLNESHEKSGKPN